MHYTKGGNESMDNDSTIGTVLEKHTASKAYDTYCKKILSNKQILANIMRGCVPEYSNMNLDEIVDCIEPSSNNDDYSINGLNTDDLSIDGALIKYDVLFEAKLPGTKNDKIGLIINIEAQNNHNPGYPLVSRALYYCSRLLARQKNMENGFTHSNFGDIKKVYSIWICTSPTKKMGGIINKYSIKEECLGKEIKENKEAYDLLQVVILYPEQEYNYDDDNHSLLELLNILFMAKMDAKNRKMQLSKNYGIMVSKIEKEVMEMCNLSQYHVEKGIQEGLEKGIQEGIEKGIEKGAIKARIEDIKSLMRNLKLDRKKAIEVLNVSEDLIPEVNRILDEEEKEKSV